MKSFYHLFDISESNCDISIMGFRIQGGMKIYAFPTILIYGIEFYHISVIETYTLSSYYHLSGLSIMWNYNKAL